VRQQDERDLRTALREEADRHRPDREAMLDRVNQGRAAPAHRPFNRAFVLLRPAAAAFAVAVVLVLAVAGVRVANRGPEADDTPASAPSVVPTTPAPAPKAVPKPSTAVTTTSRPSRSATDAPGTTTGTTGTTKSTSSTTVPKTDRDGYLASTGQVDANSTDGWSQGNVVLETTRTLTALDVSVEVALTPGAVETGRWSTVPVNLLAITSERTNKKLIYRFTLQQGATLAAGKYTFAVQFNHTGKRSAADDSYVARVTGDGKDAKVSGGFAPK
jgi:hypothetical protein